MPDAAPAYPQPPAIAPEPNLTAPQWGMLAFLVSEVAFFSTLIVTYALYLGQDADGPTPAEALSLPLVCGTTACLLASSFTIHAAEAALRRGQAERFRGLWTLTIALGLAFLAGTAYEWHDLIVDKQLTISRNLFGTTYYTLVGFHALHVTAGLVALGVALALAAGRHSSAIDPVAVELISWYWHFVDAVWIVVFLVVYVAGTGKI